jgi:hypothetical protein
MPNHEDYSPALPDGQPAPDVILTHMSRVDVEQPPVAVDGPQPPVEPITSTERAQDTPTDASEASTALATPFKPGNIRDWASEAAQRDKEQHAAPLPMRVLSRLRRGPETRLLRRAPAAILLASLALAACSPGERAEGVVPTIKPPTEATAPPTTEVGEKEKVVVEQTYVHTFITFDSQESSDEAYQQSLEAAQTAADVIKSSTRGSYDIKFIEGGAHTVTLSEEERALLLNSQFNPNEARIAFSDAIARELQSQEGVILGQDGLIATVDVSALDSPLYLEGSVVEGDSPMNTQGIKLDMGNYPAIVNIISSDMPVKDAASLNIFAHELGHNIVPGYSGLGHSNLADCTMVMNTPYQGLPFVMPAGTCEAMPYGNKTDIMGESGLQQWRPGELFSPVQLLQMDVLKKDEIELVDPKTLQAEQTLSYDLHTVSSGEKGKKIIVIPLDGSPPVYDMSIPENASLSVAIYYSPEYKDLLDGEEQEGAFDHNSVKVAFIAWDAEGHPLSSFAVPLTPMKEDFNGFRDVGAPPDYIGRVFEGSGVEIEIVSQNGNTASVQLSASTG